MSFTNPKPAGYAFGEVLPSGHVNTVWANLSNALDGLGGGSCPLTGAALTLAGLGLIMTGPLVMSGANATTRHRTLNKQATATVDVSTDIINADPVSGSIVITLRHSTAPVPFVGNVLSLSRAVNNSPNTVSIRLESGFVLCTMPVSAYSWADVIYMDPGSGAAWALHRWSSNITPYV